MIRCICFLVSLLPLTTQAQFTYFLDQSIPVHDLWGDPLAMPWAGGLNAAQVNTMDLNGDETDDLVIFDRMAGRVITFVSAQDRYIPAPEFENFFPEGIENWLLLRDYNCDGRKDIFTGDVLGIKVYRNITTAGESPAWEQHLFTTGFVGSKSPVLLTQGSSNKVNLQLQFDDLPSISDIDGDGDLDILNIQYAGHTIEFHQNLSIENGQPCDSLDFIRVTRSWGAFRECHCGEFAFNDANCPPHAGGRTKHAGGKSLLALDVDGDEQQDLLFSEAECTQLFLLPNEGTSVNPSITNFSTFPHNNPVNFVLFPAVYHEDVDFDGKKDLIASPNIFTKEFLNSDLQQSTWLYKNMGTDSHPVFTYVKRNFLQGDMIDVGDNAVPAFADVDADGDFDMFVSTNSSEEFAARILLFENTGSSAAPAFSLVSDNYPGLPALSFYNLKVQFADIDSNETLDLVFTATSLSNGLTNLYYLKNKSQTSIELEDGSPRMLDFELTSSENVYFTDVNGDGLPDILAGRSEGNLEYWKNSGIEGAPLFTLEDDSFLGLGTSTTRQNLTCAVADLDGDGKADLALGDQSGRLGVMDDYLNFIDAEPVIDRNLVFNSILEAYVEQNLGGQVWPAVVNLFNTDKPAIVVGNVLGGIHLLRHDDGTSLPEDPEVNVYPNPVAKDGMLKIQSDRYGTIEIISLLGQRLSLPRVIKANQINQFTLPPLAAGLYLLKFTANNKTRVQRLVIQ